MDNDRNVCPSLNSGDVGPSKSHSAIWHRDNVLIMEWTASDKPSSEGLRIAHNVVNELGDLNDSCLVEGYCLRLRDARTIIGSNDEVSRRQEQRLDDMDANH